MMSEGSIDAICKKRMGQKERFQVSGVRKQRTDNRIQRTDARRRKVERMEHGAWGIAQGAERKG
jgi:hypothetical protein